MRLVPQILQAETLYFAHLFISFPGLSVTCLADSRCSAVRLAHHVRDVGVAGSNPVTSTPSFLAFGAHFVRCRMDTLSVAKFFLLFLTLSSSLSAQPTEQEEEETQLAQLGVAGSQRKLDKHLRVENYRRAVKIYKRELALKPRDPMLNYRIAENYRKMNKMHESIPYYRVAFEEGYLEDDVCFKYARSLKLESRYSEAEQVLSSCLERSFVGADERRRIEVYLHGMRQLHHLEEDHVDSHYRVANLSSVNGAGEDYSPTFNNGKLYFVSDRGGRQERIANVRFTALYEATIQEDDPQNLSSIRALPTIINTRRAHEGPATFTQRGHIMIFARGNTGKSRGTQHVNLYYSRREREGKWGKVVPMNINDANSFDSTPHLSSDGNTLYFSSSRPGGYGGVDIYTSKRSRRGWRTPRNMGPEVNTPHNELFPYFGPDGNFYFSSDGHPGYGGLDVFVSIYKGGEHDVDNIGKPVNSASDDFGFVAYDHYRGYFCSNRAGGEGGDDIYFYVNNDPELKILNMFLKVTVFTDVERQGELRRVPVPEAELLLFKDEDTLIDQAISGSEGYFAFRVHPEEEYLVKAEKADYLAARTLFSTVDKKPDLSQTEERVVDVTFEVSLVLDKIRLLKPIVLENIYYDLDSADIRDDAAEELNKLYHLMVDNPEIEIELSSHTDARAGDRYNMDLSQRRAESATNYLIIKGIDPNRIVARGYGESKLLIPSAQTEEEHQQNRRTEFRVTKYDRRKFILREQSR